MKHNTIKTGIIRYYSFPISTVLKVSNHEQTKFNLKIY